MTAQWFYRCSLGMRWVILYQKINYVCNNWLPKGGSFATVFPLILVKEIKVLISHCDTLLHDKLSSGYHWKILFIIWQLLVFGNHYAACVEMIAQTRPSLSFIARYCCVKLKWLLYDPAEGKYVMFSSNDISCCTFGASPKLDQSGTV